MHVNPLVLAGILTLVPSLGTGCGEEEKSSSRDKDDDDDRDEEEDKHNKEAEPKEPQGGEPTDAVPDPAEELSSEESVTTVSNDETSAWVEDAVADALYYEVMPGVEPDGEPTDTHIAELRAFFNAHPQYADPSARERLALHLCGMGGIEEAHEFLENPPPKTPAVVTDDRSDWLVFVNHRDVHCTSDDWGWYSAEANENAASHGAVLGFGGPNNDVILVKSNGTEVARIPLSGQGFVIARAGAEPAPIAYDPSIIASSIEAYLSEVQ